MSEDTRIKQFKQMAEADPENELGHFSLGKAYKEAGRFEEAVESLKRALELNSKMSKTYQLLGEAYESAERRDEAIEVTTRGVAVADELGDRLPRDAMASALKEWGAPVPTLKGTDDAATATETAGGTSASGFRCARCGRPDGQLPKAPFKGALGERVLELTCTGCWREWIPMGTKVINEMGLALASKEGQDTYDQYMMEFLQIDSDTSLDPHS